MAILECHAVLGGEFVRLLFTEGSLEGASVPCRLDCEETSCKSFIRGGGLTPLKAALVSLRMEISGMQSECFPVSEAMETVAGINFFFKRATTTSLDFIT